MSVKHASNLTTIMILLIHVTQSDTIICVTLSDTVDTRHSIQHFGHVSLYPILLIHVTILHSLPASRYLNIFTHVSLTLLTTTFKHKLNNDLLVHDILTAIIFVFARLYMCLYYYDFYYFYCNYYCHTKNFIVKLMLKLSSSSSSSSSS